MKLLYIFSSKDLTYKSISIDHRTLKNCLAVRSLYLETFFFSREIIEEGYNEEVLNLSELKQLVLDKRKIYDVKIQPKSKKFFAENIKYPELSKTYNSINSFANEVKGDRSTIRQHLSGKITNKLYKNEWKFKLI